MPHYRPEGVRQGSGGVFWGLCDNICTLYVCVYSIHQIKFFGTQDWALFIVVIVPRVVKVHNFLKKNGVSEVKITFLIFSVVAKKNVLFLDNDIGFNKQIRWNFRRDKNRTKRHAIPSLMKK